MTGVQTCALPIYAARAFVDALDREALARQSRISRAIAGDVLRSMGGGEDQARNRTETDCSDGGGDAE